MIRDLCPRGHGPMWHWPAGGSDVYACQRSECDAKQPLTQSELDARFAAIRNAGMRAVLLATPPSVMSPGLFRNIYTS